jgi:hypothetical protein
MELDKFLKKFKATQAKCGKPKNVSKYRKLLPDFMFELWEKHGFGKYNDGLIEIIDPNDYLATLETWLGKKTPNYVPIMISGFGDLFYYRKLSETDEDVCRIDPHYGKITTTPFWSLKDFFNEYLCKPSTMNDILDKKLFKEAIKKKGRLGENEIYLFAPTLALGGAREIEYVDKGNCRVHLEMLFQLSC